MLIIRLFLLKECRLIDVFVRFIDRVNEVFDFDGGSDDLGFYLKK